MPRTVNYSDSYGPLYTVPQFTPELRHLAERTAFRAIIISLRDEYITYLKLFKRASRSNSSVSADELCIELRGGTAAFVRRAQSMVHVITSFAHQHALSNREAIAVVEARFNEYVNATLALCIEMTAANLKPLHHAIAALGSELIDGQLRGLCELITEVNKARWADQKTDTELNAQELTYFTSLN